ncbi:MAG TPA: hypothetical protein VLC98_05880 [Phnomibacter sp.]|nr:hypothetical protein [Phnomibacter sp.]
MKASKLALSSAEWQMAYSTEVILTKNRIIEEVYNLFGELSVAFQKQGEGLKDWKPELFAVHPKISRGENYEGMPWVMLDYPREYSKEHGHFAIRCFFWWGHFFSINLQLSGAYLQQLHPALQQLQQQQWMVGCTNDPWNLQLPNEQWEAYDAALFHANAATPLFGKAAKKIPVANWTQVHDFFEASFLELMGALHASR